MPLSYSVAKRVVEQITKTVAIDITIVDQFNVVLATSRPAGSGAPADEKSISLPLHYDDQEIGRLIVTDETGRGKAAAQVAQALVELIIHQRLVSDEMFNRQWVLDKYVSDLLHGRFQNNIDTALEGAMVLEIELNMPRIVAMVDIFSLIPPPRGDAGARTQQAGVAEERLHRQRRRHLLDLVARCLGDNRATIFSFVDQHWLMILAAVEADAPDVASRQVKGEIQAFLDELGRVENSVFSAGIGRYARGWQDLPQSYEDARFALLAQKLLTGGGHVAATADLGLAGFVCTHNDAIKSELAVRILQPLLDKPDLLETLDVFLQADLAVGPAAERLGMHRHGLTYRLNKIHELTGMDPTNFHDAVLFAAALQWQKFEQPEAASSLLL